MSDYLNIKACRHCQVLDTLDAQARVAEWQTRRTQNPLSERVCGFDSHLGHFATNVAQYTYFMTAHSISERFVERRLRRGTQTMRELRDQLKITDEQLEFFSDEARDKEVRAMVAETPDSALEHHQAQRHLEVFQRHHDYLVGAIAEQEARQDQLLDKLTD